MANPSFPQFADSINENNLLKDWYTPERVRDLVFKKYPFTMLLRKNMDVSGRQLVVPQIFTDPQGTANTFSIANGNQFPLQSATYLMIPNQKYTIDSITARLMRQSRDKEGAFLDLLKENIDKSLKTHVNRLHIDLVANDGSGALAQIASVTPIVLAPYTNVVAVQLVIPEQARYFEPNARLTLADVKLPPFAVTAIGTVVQVQFGPGIIVLALDAPAPVGTLNWMGFDGDFVTNDIAQGATNWQGLPAWIPTVAQRAVPGFLDIPFNGVIRSSYPERLAGTAIDLPGSPVKSALIRLAAAIDVMGGTPDTAFLHQFNFSALAESLGPNVLYDNVVLSTEANISYRSIVLQTETGEVRIVQDSAVPKNTMYMLEMNTWELACWGDFANIVQDDGLTVLRNNGDNGDSVTWRARTFGSLCSHAVGFNGVVTI